MQQKFRLIGFSFKQIFKSENKLESHTDCRADSLYNIKSIPKTCRFCGVISNQTGIDSARLVSRGYGENQLAVERCKCEGPNEREQGQKCTEEEHQLNRRTTVQILDINFVKKPKEIPVDPKKPALPQGRQREQQQHQHLEGKEEIFC
jgi:hypothetical protein